MEEKLNNTESFKMFKSSGYKNLPFPLSQKETFGHQAHIRPQCTPLCVYNTSSHFQAPFTTAFNIIPRSTLRTFTNFRIRSAN